MKKIKQRSSAIVGFILVLALLIGMIPTNVVLANTAEENYTVISLADSADYVAGALAGTKGFDLGSDKTLDNTRFEGKFKFSAHTSNAIYIGYNEGGGLLIQPQADGTLGLRWRSKAHEDVAQGFKYITTTEGNVNSFVGEWFELRVGFTFSDKTEDRANVTASVQINDGTPVEYKTTATVPLGMLTRGVFLQGYGVNAPLYHDLIEEEVEAQVISLANHANYVPGAYDATPYKLSLGTSGETLNHTIFTHSFRITSTSHAMYIGQIGQRGLKLQVTEDGNLAFTWRSNNGDSATKIISADTCERDTFLNQWFDLSITFVFSVKTATTAMVTANIQIDEYDVVKYESEHALLLTELAREVRIEGGSADYPIYHSPVVDFSGFEGYEEISLKDCAGYTPGAINRATGYNLGNDKTLDNTVFSGEFKFTNAAEATSTIRLGGGGMCGLHLFLADANTLQVNYRTNDASLHNLKIQLGQILASDVGIESFVNDWIQLKVGISFVEPGETYTGLKVSIKINEYAKSFTVANNNNSSNTPMIAALMRYVSLQGSQDYPLHHRVREAYEPEIITMLDKIGAVYTAGQVTTTTGYDLGANKGLDLDNTKLLTRIKFTSLENSNNALYVGMYGGGVRIIPQADDTLQIYWRVKKGEFDQVLNLGSITANDAGVTSFKDEWLDLSFEFHFANKSTDKTDLNFTITIGDAFEQTYSVPGAALVGLTRYVCMGCNNSDYPIYHESPIETEYYNVNNIGDGYLLSGKGEISVNNQPKEAGDALTKAGDYIIRCKLYGTYVKHVILYRPGDANADNKVDILDFIAVQKALDGETLNTYATKKGADANQDDKFDTDDIVKVKKFILGIDTQEDAMPLPFEEGVMPIVGYYGPYRITDAWGESYDLITDDTYKNIADLGINLINYTSADYKAESQRKDIIDNLSLAEKYGIGMYVYDSRISGDITTSQFVDYIGEYSKYASYKGNFLVDEPYTKEYTKYTTILDTEWSKGNKKLEDYVACAKKLNSFANTIGYINLNPIAERLKVNLLESLPNAYRKYIDAYLTTDARFISWDYYVWDQKLGSADLTKQYFQNMSIAKEKADAANIPFWTYVQAGSNWNGSQISGIAPTQADFPSQSELLWNVNTSLAYGAKGIQYFTLVQPAYFAFTEDEEGNKTYDYRRNGLIGADGTPNTLWYNAAKKANQQIAIVDEYLMKAKHLAVITSGQNNAQAATGTTDTYGSFKIATDSKGRGALAGVFDYFGKTALYVMNYDTSGDSSNQVTIDFGSNKNYTVISGDQLVSDEKTGTGCTLTLIDGGAALILLQ